VGTKNKKISPERLFPPWAVDLTILGVRARMWGVAGLKSISWRQRKGRKLENPRPMLDESEL